MREKEVETGRRRGGKGGTGNGTQNRGQGKRERERGGKMEEWEDKRRGEGRRNGEVGCSGGGQ